MPGSILSRINPCEQKVAKRLLIGMLLLELETQTPQWDCMASEGYNALRESAAWIDLSSRGRIRMTGEDRARLLHAMTTNHVQVLKPGDSCYLFLDRKSTRLNSSHIPLSRMPSSA